MKKFNKILQWLVFIGAVAWLGYYFSNNRRVYDREKATEAQHVVYEGIKVEDRKAGEDDLSIARLTAEDVVVDHVRAHGKLPEYYMTKSEAREKGWDASKENLCDVLPGKAIGGDRFGNRESRLPEKKGRRYFEADLNYHCGKRGADRLIFSDDGLIFVSKDHYNTFEKR
jgi:hypothetical protein